jgi:hypothetical protein
MLTKSIITFAAALSTASAAVLPRQVVTPQPAESGDGIASGIFNITGFSVGQQPHSLYTYYYLTVEDLVKTGPENITTTCRASTTTIPAITGFQLQACDDPSVKWSFVPTQEGYNLTVKHNVSIPLAEFAREFY